MTADNQNAEGAARIRAIIYERVEGIGNKDGRALVVNHAPEAVIFDVLDPLHYRGAETVRERAEKWLAGYATPIGYEVRDLDIVAGGDVAFCRYLYRVSGTTNEGGEVDMWVRATVCFQKNEGEWQIVHAHQSVPFDGATGKASLDLQP